MYKIISKILANRLKPWIQDIITLLQAAFVPNRCIQDNIFMDQEAFHALKKRRTGRKTTMAIKVDLRKAYDSVN